MNKKDFKLLEKIFAAEIEGRLPYQSKSKQYERLEQSGMVEKETIALPGRFPVTVSGWVLTHRGRMEYCEMCKDEPEEPDDLSSLRRG